MVYSMTIFLFYTFLLICKVEATIMEKDESQNMLVESITPLPIVLHLSKSRQSDDNKMLQMAGEKNPMAVEDQLIFRKKRKEELGTNMEKLEEEPAAEPEGEEEAPPEVEESKGEKVETEPAAEKEAEPEAEEEGETAPVGDVAAEAEAETAVEPEEPKEEEPPAEHKVEEKPEPEPERAAASEEEKEDESQDMLAESITPLPIVSHLSKSIQSDDNEILQTATERNTMPVEGFRNISNDIEVFKEKLGTKNEKQEEEPVAEPEGEEEAPPEAEEPKEEEVEAEPVAEPEAEPEAEPAAEEEGEAAPEGDAVAEAEAEADTAVEPEEPKEEEPPAEPEIEEKPVSEPDPAVANEKDKEVVQLDNEPSSSEGAAAENNESEMPNDEPAKEEEKDKIAKDETVNSAAKDTNKKEISCFACTSNEDAQCSVKAKEKVPCPKVNEGDEGKHNGCYTLFQADTNITMRGCVDDLAEEGLKFCLTNEKLCNLCYTNGCNDKMAPSSAKQLQLNIFSLLFFTIFPTIIRELASFAYTK